MGRKFAAVLIILMLAGPLAAIEAYAVVAGTHAGPSSVTSQEFYSTLQLSIGLHNTVVAQGGNVNFTVTLENLGPSPITAPVSSDWPDQGQAHSPFPCSFTYYSFSIYRGDYSGDMSPPSGQMVQLFYPGVYECPLIGPTPHYYVFGPGQAVQHHFSYSGYYTNNPSTGWTQVPFPAGAYTLYAQDMWGQFVTTTFVVS